MKEDAYEQLINIALETKDFKWIKELQKQKSQEMLKNLTNNEYIISGTAFEDLTYNYVVIEERGIRNIRFESEYDIIYGKVGVTNGEIVCKGQNVKYRDIKDEERCYVLGYLRGYYDSLKVPYSYKNNQTISPPIQKPTEVKNVENNIKNKKWWNIFN